MFPIPNVCNVRAARVYSYQGRIHAVDVNDVAGHWLTKVEGKQLPVAACCMWFLVAPRCLDRVNTDQGIEAQMLKQVAEKISVAQRWDSCCARQAQIYAWKPWELNCEEKRSEL